MYFSVVTFYYKVFLLWLRVKSYYILLFFTSIVLLVFFLTFSEKSFDYLFNCWLLQALWRLPCSAWHSIDDVDNSEISHATREFLSRFRFLYEKSRGKRGATTDVSLLSSMALDEDQAFQLVPVPSFLSLSAVINKLMTYWHLHHKQDNHPWAFIIKPKR